MKTVEVKTNIMCGSCVAKVTPVLDETFGKGKWKVDTQNPKKVLTVSADEADASEVIKAVEKAGYTAQQLA